MPGLDGFNALRETSGITAAQLSEAGYQVKNGQVQVDARQLQALHQVPIELYPCHREARLLPGNILPTYMERS